METGFPVSTSAVLSPQVLLNDMAQHTQELEDLIWQGSQISTNGKFLSRDDLKAKLKSYDQRWVSCHKQTQRRLAALKSVEIEMSEKEQMFLKVASRLDNIWETVIKEQTMKKRSRESLEKFLEIYEVLVISS